MTIEEQFESLDVRTVERYVAERKSETLQLDFKTVADQPMRNTDDKKNFAKALSGFANSDGGIVVWGVQTDKVADVDVAVSERPVPNVQALEGRLLELESEAVSPSVDGVRHKALQRPDGSGFAATLVLASDRGPHMAKLGEDRYYKRSGTSFRRCEHFDLDDMFGRRPKPKLSLHCRIDGQLQTSPDYSAATQFVRIGIENRGRGIAKFPYLYASTSPVGLVGAGPRGWNPISLLKGQSYGVCLVGGADVVIHPESAVEVLQTIEFRASLHHNLKVSYLIGAEGIEAVAGTWEIPIRS